MAADPNNNSVEEKYRLRPRKRCEVSGEEEFEEEICWASGGGNGKRRRKGSAAGGKGAPLSKYRRKTANARERTRMREINEAFDSLRRAVPVCGEGADRLTKISTLRLAMSYIAALSDALSTTPTDDPTSPTSSTTPSDSQRTMEEELDELRDNFRLEFERTLSDTFGSSALDFDDFLAIDIT